MTLLEYFDTPETPIPQELIYGAHRVADAPLVNHQRVVLRLATVLQTHVESHALGEVLVAPIDVILDADRALVLQPDLLFVTRQRDHIVRERVYGPPDLVVEVLSPHPRIGALDERIRWFAAYGVREIWLYDQPARQLHVMTCRRARVTSTTALHATDRLRSTVLPSLRRPVISLVDGKAVMPGQAV